MDVTVSALMMAPPGSNPIVGFLPIVAMLAIMYFLLLRPQQKEAKRHQQMLNALKKGDEVVTVGGLYGKVLALTEERVSLRVDDGVKVEVDRAKIMRVVARPGGGTEKGSAEMESASEKGSASLKRSEKTRSARA